MASADKTVKPDLKSFTDILPVLPIIPDENPMDFTSFQAGLWNDLSPNSPYASVLADSIIAKEWELYRLRRWQSSLTLSRAEEQLSHALSKLLPQTSSPEVNIKDLAKAACRESDGQNEALEILEELGINVSQTLAQVYVGDDDAVLHFERQISALENSRRRLRADFNEVNKRFHLTAEEAEEL